MRLIKQLLHSPALIILHLSLLFIIAGGVTTWLTAEDDMAILRPGEPVRLHDMTLELREFNYKSYESELTINGQVSHLGVNHPLRVGRWRLYQQSFTPDGCSIIAMRADLPGTVVTFIGYALFALGGLWSLLRRKKTVVFALLSVISLSSKAVPVVKSEIADSLERVQVVYQGRVAPYATVAHDALQKIYGRSSYKGLSASRTILSLTLFPDEWNAEPIIKSKHGKISLTDCFDRSGNYLMYDDVDADERIGVILLLRRGEFCSKSDTQPLSSARVEAEILYNRIPSTLIIFIALFIAAGLSFFGRKPVLAWLALILQLAVIGVQCWLLGHGPFSSTFETLQFLVAVVIIFALCIKSARAPILLAAGCMALVAHLQHANPMVTPLMPVLYSPWLSLHVSLVMTSYAMLLVVAVMAAVGLFSNADEMRCHAMQLLRPAVYLLGLGIITGSIWANEAWGRYWGWDPKETAALITFLIYAIPLHMRKPSLWWLILPLISVAITYFGVNLLPSLHAYS